jgi:hypothetical protein
MGVVISIPIWGQKYYEIMSQYLIPSLLIQGNLPKMSLNHEIFIDIYSERNTLSSLKKELDKSRIHEYCKINLLEIEPAEINQAILDSKSKYDLYGKLHLKSIIKAAEQNHVCITMAPDVIFTNHFLSEAIRLLDNNQVVFKTSLRVDLDKFKNFIKLHNINSDISIKQGRKILENCLHEEMKQFILDKKNNFFSPQRVIIPFKKKTFLYGADLHPFILSNEICVALKERLLPKDENGSIDSVNFYRIIFAKLQINRNYVIIDSDEIGFQLDLTESNSRSTAGFHKICELKEVTKHLKLLGPEQRFLYGRKIVFRIVMAQNRSVWNQFRRYLTSCLFVGIKIRYQRSAFRKTSLGLDALQNEAT